jgi:uncharacterized protein (DUF924 family)
MAAENFMDVEAVLGFWFGADDVERPEWFRADPAFDREIATRFGAAIDAALAGELDAWADTPRGALARIVLLDQFTRNAFRGTPRAFAGDALALAAARRMVREGQDDALTPMQRQFAYMPFEHAEDLEAQREGVKLIGAKAPASQLEWAVKHHDVIARFGRFPHRNEILGRESTPEEVAFLKQPGSRF